MKKTLVVAAVTGLFASVAHAQSSVTLYGLIDAGFTYSNNVRSATGSGARWAATSGNINGSRWGLRGTEDLGGGLKAIFVLENGFNIMNGTNGQNGRMFGRQAFVGLSSNQYGQVTLGRQYDSVVDFLGPLSLTGTGYGGTYAAHPFDNDNLDNSFRVNNSIKYTSANYNGFRFGGQYGFSNTSEFANNRSWSAGASYNFAGFNIAAGYLQRNNSLTGLNTSGAVYGDAPLTGTRQRTWGAGLNYAFGPAQVGFVFTQSRYDDGVVGSAGSATYTGFTANDLRFNNYEVNARYNLTPAWNVSGQYTYTDGRASGVSGTDGGQYKPKFHTVSLMTAYSLSKRTDVYLQGVYQRLSGDDVFGGAGIYGVGQSSTDRQVAVTAGVRHRF
ncbi:porin [Chitinasiproducens palmae]|uniref:Porin, GBP family n=1 Tax=Chitinasiproducens palmae TaxID=1770053 RepID=A0A1H2PV54_9BURK|nr:porin [Chitinasiproducens palmae]SDV51121.1 porin, GBP family [Chitinasiproducens palmae]